MISSWDPHDVAHDRFQDEDAAVGAAGARIFTGVRRRAEARSVRSSAVALLGGGQCPAGPQR